MPAGSGKYLIQVWRTRPEKPVLGLQGERGVGIEDERGREGGAGGGGRGAGNRIKIQVLLSSEKNMPEQTFFFF